MAEMRFSKNVNVLFSAAQMVRAMMTVCLLTVLVVFSSCEKERLAKPLSNNSTLKDSVEVLKENYSSSQRTLSASATAVDTLVKSDATFKQIASMFYSDEAGIKYSVDLNPYAYAYVRQSKERIEVASEAEIRPYLTKREVISDVPVNTGTYFGRDVHVRYTFSDGDVDDLFYGYKSMGLVYEGDTLQTPHAEIVSDKLDTIYVAQHGVQTELDKPHKVTTKYVLTFVDKGVSGRQSTNSVALQPWRVKSITDDPQTVTGEIKYEGKYVGCPITAYQLKQIVPTNKGVVVTEVSVPVKCTVTAPELREQPSLDSLFNEKSTGTFKESLFSESVNEDGFTLKTMSGTYVSKNVGKEAQTSVESTINFTYSFPTKFENKWGSYEIEGLKMSFEEGGFTMKSISQDEDNHVWETTNMVIPTLGTCTLDVVDEVVKITVAKEKPVYVLPVDSTYTKSGKGDAYIVDKTVFFSDGSKTTSKFQYDGRHSATAVNFGEVITSNLAWNASGLKANGTSNENDEKVFTPTTKFSVVYTTTNVKSDATNGIESGVFGFAETHPVVTFVDGDTKIVFDERKVVLSGKGAQPAADYNVVVRNGVSYKGYAYNMACGVIFDGEAESDVVSQGLLLIVADQVGTPTYTHEQSWNGNVTTVKVIKTTPHSFGEDEVENYVKEFTVGMTNLSDGKVYAEDFNFSATVTNSENESSAQDGFWSTKSFVRNFNYVISNGAVKREMSNVVTDGEITFNDGTYTFTFPARLSVAPSESFGEVRTEGDYKVTPHIETVTASIVGGPQLTTTGKTDIYVEQDKVGDVSYKTEESWSGNTYTAKVIKTTKHTKAQDDVETFTKSVAVSMSDLSNGRVDAENTNFSATVTNTENENEVKDSKWTVKTRTRDYTYVVSNGVVNRQMTNKVSDATIVFADGTYTHTFSPQLAVSHTESKGNTTKEGDYEVTPHTVSVTATAVGGPTLTTQGVTSIYVFVKKEVTYEWTAPLDEIAGGSAYYDLTVTRKVNGVAEKSWNVYSSFIRFGTYRPNVNELRVLSTNIKRHDDSIDDLPEQSNTKVMGDENAFTVEVSAKEYHFRAFWNSPVDADGNSEGEVSGHINVWSSKVTFKDPETGHTEVINFAGTATSEKSEVLNSVYTRLIYVRCNGTMINEQLGTVRLNVVQ